MTEPVARDNLLPTNAYPRELAIHDADAAVQDLDVAYIVRCRDPERAPLGGPLEALAWERSVDVYDATWPEVTKRAVVVASPEVHRHKGTPYAVRTALAALGLDASIVEWWQTAPKGVPYTFDVLIFAHAPGGGFAVLDQRTIRNAFATVLRTKPESRAFALHIRGEVDAALGLAAVGAVKMRLRLGVSPAPAP